MDLLTDTRREVLEPLRAAGYTDREIEAAVEAIAAAAVVEAFKGGAVEIVSRRILEQRIDAARAAHEKALTSRPVAIEMPGANVVELRRVPRP